MNLEELTTFKNKYIEFLETEIKDFNDSYKLDMGYRKKEIHVITYDGYNYANLDFFLNDLEKDKIYIKTVDKIYLYLIFRHINYLDLLDVLIKTEETKNENKQRYNN